MKDNKDNTVLQFDQYHIDIKPYIHATQTLKPSNKDLPTNDTHVSIHHSNVRIPDFFPNQYPRFDLFDGDMENTEFIK